MSNFLATRLNKLNEQLLKIAKLQQIGHLGALDPEQMNTILFQPDVDLSISKLSEKIQEICMENKIPLGTVNNLQLATGKIVAKASSGKVLSSDKEIIANLKKNLLNTRKRNKELKNELEDAKKCINNMKEQEQQHLLEMKESLDKFEEQKKLVEKANNFATEMAKQSDLIKSSRDNLLNQVSRLKKEVNDLVLKNNNLKTDCEKWKIKTELEEKKCHELSEDLRKLNDFMEDVVKEKTKFEETIVELINLLKLYKKKECEMQLKEAACVKKEQEFDDILMKVNDLSKECENVRNENEGLKSVLENKTKEISKLKDEMEKYRESFYYELKIKEKVFLDKCDTIDKQKKLLKESDSMVLQAAQEFESLKEQLQKEKEANKSLQNELSILKAATSKVPKINNDKRNILRKN